MQIINQISIVCVYVTLTWGRRKVYANYMDTSIVRRKIASSLLSTKNVYTFPYITNGNIELRVSVIIICE